MIARRLSAILPFLLIAACSNKNKQPSGSQQTTSAKADTGAGMKGMQGMSMPMMNAAGMDSMRSEMSRMRAMSPADLRAAMPMHRQMTANMLAQMNADMRGMNMAGDPTWNALVDSVRQDLVRLPDVPASGLSSALTPHLARVERLMSMHQSMMKR